MFRENLSKFNIEMTSADFSDLEAVAGGIKENTKLIYFESMSNPMMELSDIQEISRIAHDRGIKVVVDNTFTPPPEIRPLSLGADLVVHSTTKYINGHGDAIGGAIIGAKEELDPIRSGITTKLLGTTPSPFNSYLVLRGMQTMELRMQRHCENGFAIASFLEGSPHVKRVYYPGLSSSPQHALAEKMMKGNYGGILAFELKDGIHGMKAFDACKKLLNSFTIPSIAVSLGDPGTLVEHAASMTHGAVPAEEREREGSWHRSGDLGELREGKLYYLGRRDVYLVKKGRRVPSGPLEQRLLLRFPTLSKAACFYSGGKNRLFYEECGGKTEREQIREFLREEGILENTELRRIGRIPRDRKHHSKTDYRALKKRSRFPRLPFSSSWRQQDSNL